MVYTEHREADVDTLDIAYESFDETVDLYGVTVSGDVEARCVSAEDHFRMPGADVGGQFYGGNMETDVFSAPRSKCEGDFYLNGADIAYNTILKDMHVGGKGNLNRGHFGSAFIEGTFEDGLSLKDAEFDGTVFLEADTPIVDVRGAAIPKLRVDDLDHYTFRVGDSISSEGWIGEIVETEAEPVSLTEKEQEWYKEVIERPKFPVQKRDGAVFSVDDLRRDFVMDKKRQGLLGSLTQKGAVHHAEDNQYVMRSDL